MTREEVKELMHDYMDDLLSAEDRSTVDSYLEEYEDIAKEYELLNKLLEKAEALPVGIKPPEDLMKKVSNELLSFSIEKVAKNKQTKLQEFTEKSDSSEKRDDEKVKKVKKESAPKSTGATLKAMLILIVLGIVSIGGYFFYDMLIDNFPWKLKAEYGQYTVNGAFANSNQITGKDQITTFDSSRVAVNIPNSGKLILESFTSIKIIQGKDSENIIALDNGRLEAEVKIDEPALKITTPPVALISLGGEFSIEILNSGEVFVQTRNGLVNLKSNIEDLLLIQDHKCKISLAGEIGIPIHNEASEEMRQLIEQAGFGNDAIINYSLILDKASPQDGVTLFYLLKDANNKADRAAIFDKLNNMYPVPPGVTKQGIVNLKDKMLEQWLSEIDWQI